MRQTTFFAILLAAAPGRSSETLRVERKALEEHIRYLASDELGGRGNGTAGLRDAARYIEQRFGALGLVPAGDRGTYLQSFELTAGQKVGSVTRVVLRDTPGTAVTLSYGSDFEPMSFSAEAYRRGALVFAGYGVTAPEHDYDDYAAIDVGGKIVLVLRYAPAPFGENGWHATFVRKAENALAHGAAAIVIVNGPRHPGDDELVPFGVDVGSDHLSIATIHARREPLERLFADHGKSLAGLQRSIDEELTPRSFELSGVEVEVAIEIDRTTVEVQNVVGYLPASRRDSAEHIVIGAHYDHIGLGEKGGRDSRARGKIHNGADDNASGVAGMLELARLFALTEIRPRGIVFAAFAGEEVGLRGSTFYTTHAAYPLDEAVAMINLDMIGRLRHDRLYLGGVERAPELSRIVGGYLEEEELSYSTRFSGEGMSDHSAFLRSGVPAVFVFTGLHGDYHKPTDDPQFINFEGMERVIRFGYNVAGQLLRTERRLVLAGDGPRSRRAGEDAYLGVAVDNAFEGDGLRFAYVAVDGPAADAGLRAGDVLLELDGRSVRSSDKAASILRKRRPGDTVTAKVRRKDKILEVQVRLSTWP